MFAGSITALITPFTNEGDLDMKAFENFVEWQIKQGTNALVPCGTTGESPTLSHAEHKSLVERCVQITNKRIPVIAGTGSNSTREAIELTQHAQEANADAALIVTPYYNKPTQEGLYQHFKAIHDETNIPIVIYNIPGRCIIDMSIETMARLAELPRIVGVKDATNDLARPALTRLAIGPDFCQLSGEDSTVWGFLAQGGHGCISVVSNIAPKLCSDMHKAWQNADLDEVARIRDLLTPLASALFCESSPAPVKYAANLLGLCENRIRRPLLPATEAAQAKVEAALKHAGLWSEGQAKAVSA